MFKKENGNVYVNWVVAIIVIMVLVAIFIKVLLGENGLIQQKKEEDALKNTEKNIMIELIDENER